MHGLDNCIFLLRKRFTIGAKICEIIKQGYKLYNTLDKTKQESNS